jgi:hypothetical protein
VPFTHKITFQLNGNKKDSGYVIDPFIAGNKMFVVTGSLQLYGLSPATVWTRLSSTAFAGSNSINVLSSSGWNVGD